MYISISIFINVAIIIHWFGQKNRVIRFIQTVRRPTLNIDILCAQWKEESYYKKTRNL